MTNQEHAKEAVDRIFHMIPAHQREHLSRENMEEIIKIQIDAAHQTQDAATINVIKNTISRFETFTVGHCPEWWLSDEPGTLAEVAIDQLNKHLEVMGHQPVLIKT